MLSGAGRLPGLTHLIRGVAVAGGLLAPTGSVPRPKFKAGRWAGRQAEVLSKGSATEP